MISLPAKSRRAAVRAVAVGPWLANLHEPAACARAETLGAALAGLLTSEAEVAASAPLSRFYRERGMAPLWVTPAGANPRGAELVAVLQAIDQDGLEPEDYDAGALAARLGARAPAQLAAPETRLSWALLEGAADLAAGRLEPSTVDPEHSIHPDEVDPEEVIRAAADATDIGAFVAGFRPAQDNYQRLRAAAAAGWPRVADG